VKITDFYLFLFQITTAPKKHNKDGKKRVPVITISPQKTGTTHLNPLLRAPAPRVRTALPLHMQNQEQAFNIIPHTTLNSRESRILNSVPNRNSATDPPQVLPLG